MRLFLKAQKVVKRYNEQKLKDKVANLTDRDECIFTEAWMLGYKAAKRKYKRDTGT